MKTLLAASGLAVVLTFGGSAVETWVGTGAQAQSCSQICANAAFSSTQEQCVSRCNAARGGNAYRGNITRVYGYTGAYGYAAGRVCGQFFYRQGGTCIDARVNPPKLN